MAYQLLLGREAENEEVVEHIQNSVDSLKDLRDLFLKSPEFFEKVENFLKDVQQFNPRHPFNLPPIPVEIDCTEAEYDQMHARIVKGWSILGETDAFWSVLTQPQYHTNEFEKNKEQFFKSGKDSAGNFISSLRRSGINHNLMHSCMDFGCGVARVSAHLAPHFTKVIGVDISQPHLDLAKVHLDNLKIDNVELLHLKGYESFNALPKVDVIFSVIVLQHNPPPIIFSLIKKLLGLLNPDGVAYFQVPTYKNGYLFEVNRYLSSEPTTSLEMHFLPQKEVFKAINQAGCEILEVREDEWVGRGDIMLSNTFIVKKEN